MHATATFELQNTESEPLFDHLGGDVQFGRRRFDKVFQGGIEATSSVEMLSGGVAAGGAGYVAIEVITGTVDGRPGSFALLHIGTMDADGEPWAMWPIVPGSGMGELSGITGNARISFADDGTHLFDLDYQLV